MRDPQLLSPLPRRGRDVYQAPWVVRCDDRAPRLGDRVELPRGEPGGDLRPFEAERAAEATAVGDVRYVDALVAGQLQHPPRLGLQPKLAEGLARIVIRDPRSIRDTRHERRSRFEELENKARRVPHSR